MVFLFLVAGLIAFLLNPIVRTLTRVWIPRGFGVALVPDVGRHVASPAIVIGTVVVDQTKSGANRVNDYFTVEQDEALAGKRTPTEMSTVSRSGSTRIASAGSRSRTGR